MSESKTPWTFTRESYERGGWADGRLGQAYDLLDAVADSLQSDSELRDELHRIRDAIENADCELEKLRAA